MVASNSGISPLAFHPPLPPEAGTQRDNAILHRILQGKFDRPTWAKVISSIPGHTATFRIMADALKMDGIRLNVSAVLEQQIADAIGARMLTPRLADLLFLQRGLTIPPQIGEISSSTQAMIARSQKVDQAIQRAREALLPARPKNPIVQTVGKHWVLSNALALYPVGAKGENYGWHFPGATLAGSAFESSVTPPLRITQGEGWAHPPQHSDASQTCVLVAARCVVDGRDRSLLDVLTDPALADLCSHEGVLRVLRQPGVVEGPCVAAAARCARTPHGGIRGTVQGLPIASGSLTGAAIGGIFGGPIGVAIGGGVGFLVDRWRA